VQIIDTTTSQREQDKINAPAPSIKHEATTCQTDQYQRAVAQTMQAYAETCKFHKKTYSQPNDTTLASKKSDFVIPKTMKAALHDMRFAPQWRVAIRNEFYKWKDAGYNDIFTTGKWTFKINTNKAIEMIYFKATCEMPEPIISELPQQCKMPEPIISDMIYFKTTYQMPEPTISEVPQQCNMPEQTISDMQTLHETPRPIISEEGHDMPKLNETPKPISEEGQPSATDILVFDNAEVD
jgi:hypothetical protein